MGNRPINRRPFRRKPWAKKRPTRWNAATNGMDETNLRVLNTAVPPNVVDGVGPLAIICDGQIDVEPWADEQEVTIDRVVGTICVYGSSMNITPDTALIPHVILKLGMVLNEELTHEDPGPVVTRNLFSQEDLEDTEWMWLHTLVIPYNSPVVDSTLGAQMSSFEVNVPLDLRNRRKIGQSDELALYAAWCATAPNFDVAMQAYVDLRCILMSR